MREVSVLLGLRTQYEKQDTSLGLWKRVVDEWGSPELLTLLSD